MKKKVKKGGKSTSRKNRIKSADKRLRKPDLKGFFGRLYSRILNSDYCRDRMLIKKDSKTAYMIFLVDILCVASLVGFAALMGFLMEQNVETMRDSLIQNPLMLFGSFFMYIIGYFMALLLIYSFFKTIVMIFVRQLHKEKQIGFTGFWKFYFMNIMTGIVFFLIFIVLLWILMMFKTNAIRNVGGFLFIVFGFFLYTMINVNASLFDPENRFWKMVGKTFSVTFGGIRKYWRFYIGTVSWFAAFIVFFLIIGSITKYLALLGGEQTLRSAAKYYTIVFNSIAYAFFYLLIYYNRIYFYRKFNEKFG